MVAKTLIILRLEFYFALNNYISIPYSLIWLVCYTQKTYFFICFLYSYFFRQKVRAENPFRIFHPNYWLRTKNKTSENLGSLWFGAADWTWTHDLLITNQLLYQLSYSGIWKLKNRYINGYFPTSIWWPVGESNSWYRRERAMS